MGLNPLGEDFGVGDNDGYEEVLKGFSVDKDLGDQCTLDIDVFKFLWCNVLSLVKLEDVLCSIDNFN